MKICVTQRGSVRYFSRFADISDRDKLEVEVTIEDSNGKVVSFDLTSALLDEYANHPEIGRIDPEAAARITSSIKAKPVKIKESMTVSPAYLTESKKQKDEVVAKVREAQKKVVEERNKKRAELAAVRTEILISARKAKADKEAAQGKVAKPKPAVAKQVTPAKPVVKAKPAEVSKAQAAAIKKIGDVLKRLDKQSKAKGKAPRKSTTTSAKPIAKTTAQAPAKKVAPKAAKSEVKATKPAPSQTKVKKASSREVAPIAAG